MPFQNTAPTYGTVTDLAQCGAPPEAFKKVGQEEQARALYQASRFADTRLSTRYKTPFTIWSDDLTHIVCVIAAFRLLCFRGWSPADPVNAGFMMMYQEAVKTLAMVAQGDANLDLMDTSPDPVSAPSVASDPPRGL